jgi:hypothetical protein
MKTSMIGRMTVALAAVALMANVASAGLIWDSATNESFNTTGWQSLSAGNTAIAHFAIGSATTGTVAWGDTWTNVGTSATLGGITMSLDALGQTGSGAYSGGTAVLDNWRFNSSSPSSTVMFISLSGFDSNKEYILQFLQVDARANSAIYGRQGMMRVLGTTTDSGIVTVGTGNLADKTFGLIQGTFTGATSVNVQPLLAGAGATPNWNMGHINAVRIIEVIPEPASGLMLLGSMLGIGLLRRKLHG